MNNIKNISHYVIDLFNRYHMNADGFLFEWDEDNQEEVSKPLFRNGIIDNDTIYSLCVHFGLTPQEILSTDANAAMRYWNKYPFFMYYDDFLHRLSWNNQYKDPMPTPEQILMNAIFNDDNDNGFLNANKRYNYSNVEDRLYKLLDDYDKVIPGIVHKGEDIVSLEISTDTIFSFPDCTKMLQSFIDIIERIKELFFKALSSSLNKEEVNELNFLSTWTRASDVHMPSVNMTYDNILIYKNVYLSEGYTDFYDYVQIRGFVNTKPWCCMEFFDDRELVEKFVDIFPEAKQSMRKFALTVTKFSCYYIWSDAEPAYSDEEDAEFQIFGHEHTPAEERPRKVEHIYIDKLPSETEGWESYISLVKQATGPVAQGGLNPPDRSHLLHLMASRIEKRVMGRSGGGNLG